MAYGDYITPGRVLWGLAIGVATLAILGLLRIPEQPIAPFQISQGWNLFMDLVSLLSLLITLAVLSDLKEVRKTFLFQATAPNLLERLGEQGDKLGELTSGPTSPEQEIATTMSRTASVLRDIEDVVQDEEVEERAYRLRATIQDYREGEEVESDAVDILAEIRGIQESIVGLAERERYG